MYEHIDIINTVEPTKEDYLDSLKNFMRDEIEGEKVYLQNKIIGKNHINWDPNYIYSAWYKAEKEIHIGYEVTPKTNKGDYIIESSGNITVYAGERVVMKPGFHAQSGSHFHAYIDDATCVTNKSMLMTENDENNGTSGNHFAPEKSVNEVEKEELPKAGIYPNPNNGKFVIQVSEHYLGGEVTLFDTFGKKLYFNGIESIEQEVIFDVKPGVYYAVITNDMHQQVEKIMIQ